MQSKQLVSTIKELADYLTNVLSELGFSPGDWARRGDARIFSWSIHDPWHESRVELSYRSFDAAIVDVNLAVYVPCREQEDVILDGARLQSLVDRSGYYRVPTVLGGVRGPSFFRKVATDLKEGISWFKRYRSPQSALARLEAGETCHGNSDSLLVRDLKAFLQGAE